MSKGWWWLAVGAVVVGAWAARGGDAEQTAAPEKTATPQATVTETPGKRGTPEASRTPKPKATPTAAEWFEDYDPAHFAAPVRRSARKAGISPQLLMAILYNEDYKPHRPDLERSWQRIKPDAAFGIANMHRAAFDETKRGRFARRSWEELPDHPELAIEAAAWHLHDLAARLPTRRRGTFTKDELLALGYNTGSGNMRAFAGGAKPGRQAQSYLDRLHDNWDKAATAVK
ncbi:transglycosylase SLT domain-containing protein [Kribbella sp. CA-293567]|uniref:transglycosylase SLT domain-containing protein n=1 Tax=Kribbella sp. CA-293567 TaxID=3002436 RepID=UPI0022DDE46E|nr:transglycosylase SLT domain-containing protein [Kribbella sp. CA-293567]WBQ08218.1 transglycosylase SLT domain-containing protein [Kribbella sp. CA-293567]